MKYFQILFVVETNDAVQTDDPYYSWIVRSFYGDYFSKQGFEDICIKFDFVHMDGKTNYSKKSVRYDINLKTQMFSDGRTFVVYCFDYDKNSAQNAAFIEEASAYCATNGYFLAVCYREIEDVLRIPPGKSKAERVRLFTKKPYKKDAIDKKYLSFDIANLTHEFGRSNICLVIEKILDIIRRIKS